MQMNENALHIRIQNCCIALNYTGIATVVAYTMLFYAHAS